MKPIEKLTKKNKKINQESTCVSVSASNPRAKKKRRRIALYTLCKFTTCLLT